MKHSLFWALILVGIWITTLGVGMISQEKDSQEYGVQWFGIQSAENSRDISRDLWIDFESDFMIQDLERGYVFSTETDDGGLISTAQLLTINKRKTQCEDAELEWVTLRWEKISHCGDGVLQTQSSADDTGTRQFLQWEEGQRIHAWSKVGADVVVAEDALLHVWKIVWIESFAVNNELLPTEIVSAIYTEGGIQLSVKKVTSTWVSTVYQKQVPAHRASSMWIWLTVDGSLFFEVDKVLYTTDQNIISSMYVSVLTQAKWVGMKNIDFESVQ